MAQVAAYNELLGFDLSEAMATKPGEKSRPRARRRSARRRGARPRR